MQKSALIRALVTGKEIVGRGRDHYPIARDDQEYLDAIAVFNQSSEKGTKTGRAAHLKLSSDSFKYKLPSEIPFISDADNVVYVLAILSIFIILNLLPNIFRFSILLPRRRIRAFFSLSLRSVLIFCCFCFYTLYFFESSSRNTYFILIMLKN